MRKIPKCWWLASYPKAGSTWSRMAIQAYATGVLDIAQLNMCVSDMDEYTWHITSPFPVSEAGEDVLLYLRNAVILRLITGSNKTPCIIKTHNINRPIIGVDPIPKPMSAGAVYLLRDPRDVVISLSNHLQKSIDECIGILSNDQYALRRSTHGGFQLLGSWSEHVKSWQDYASVVIRYEDMIDDDVAAFERLLKGFNLDVKQPRLKKAARLCRFENVAKQNKRKRFLETPSHTDNFFPRGTSGYWKEVLTDSQRQRIENDHREVMEQYGYLEANVRCIHA